MVRKFYRVIVGQLIIFLLVLNSHFQNKGAIRLKVTKFMRICVAGVDVLSSPGWDHYVWFVFRFYHLFTRLLYADDKTRFILSLATEAMLICVFVTLLLWIVIVVAGGLFVAFPTFALIAFHLQ